MRHQTHANWMKWFSAMCASVLLRAMSRDSIAQEWTRFRGPNGSGISHAKTIPSQWTDADFNWKIALPGAGHSSPVIWGEKVFITSGDDKVGRFSVFCLKASDGSKLWQKDFPFTRYAMHGYNTFASATPTVDSERIYACRTEH